MARGLELVKAVLVGRPKDTAGLEHERLTKKIALPVFASDALSSSAYATEEMLAVLILAGTTATVVSIPIAIVITIVLGIVITSYRQTVHAYPGGASAYIVASKNLGTYPGLVAASSLLIDYVLTVAVSITAGATAITSLWPSLAPRRVLIAVVVIALITVLNLRGVKEAGALFAVPTYAYIGLIGSLVGYGLIKAFLGGAEAVIPPPEPSHIEHGPLTLALIARAYAQGSTALTGVEAVSDGVQAFRKPEAKNAGQTLVIMGALLAFLFVGITVLAHVYGVHGHSANPHRTVLALVALAVWGDGPQFFAVQIATFLILFLAANTAYSDFPRLSNFLARDRFMPRQFMNRGDRLAFSNGIVALGGLAAVLVVVYNAELTRIINLYVVGVFTSFTLSQAGMVQHWRGLKEEEPKWRRNAIVNGVGAFTTFTVLIVVLYSKFTHGAWIVVVFIPILLFFLTRIHKHYMEVRVQLRDPSRRPQPAEDNHVVLLVGSPSKEEARAFWYAERIRTRDFHAVHFIEKSDPKGGFEAQWARQIGLLPTSPMLETLPQDGGIVESVRKYIQRLRGRIPTSDFITVTVAERLKPGPILLGTRTGLRLKTGLLFTPDVVVTNVPFIEGELEEHQDVLDTGGPMRHIVIVLVAAAHNATLRGIEYAKTLSADEIRAIHVVLDPEVSEHHEAEWEALNTGYPLEFVESPYRELQQPLVDYVRPLARDGRTIVTIVLPEFVVRKWWQHLLHNQNAFDVKRTFLTEPDVIVTSVPYHLE
jgi:amino acid transporter